jgi:PAS domain-containing protein
MPFISPDDVLRRLHALHDHLPAGVVVHDADDRIVYANRMAQELPGRTEAQLLGGGPRTDAWIVVGEDGSAIPPDEFPGSVVVKTGKKVSGHIAGIVTPVGTRWLLCNAYPEHDETGRIQLVVICFTDCTALKDTQQSLQKSEERLRLVLKGSTDAPWDWDLITGEVYYSERWWTMLGYRSREGGDDSRA